jgi:hypothetical protein
VACGIARWPQGSPRMPVHVHSGCRPAWSPRSARQRWCDARWGHGSLGGAHPAGKAQGSGGGCIGQAFMDQGLPMCSGDGEAAMDGGAEEFIAGDGDLL